MNEILKTLENAVAKKEKDLAGFNNVLMGCGYIVVCGEVGQAIACKIEVNNQQVVTGQVGFDDAVNVMRFTKEDAQKIAATVKNGAGVVGRAIFIRDYLKEEIQALKETIQTFQELKAA